MRGNYLLGGLAAFTVLAAAGLAVQAQTPGGPATGQARAEGRGLMMGGQGRFRVTPEERKKLMAERFARMDANRDGKVTFEEFHAAREAARLERQRVAFNRMTEGKDALTLDQLNERGDRFMDGRGEGRGQRGHRGPMRGRGDRL